MSMLVVYIGPAWLAQVLHPSCRARCRRSNRRRPTMRVFIPTKGLNRWLLPRALVDQLTFFASPVAKALRSFHVSSSIDEIEHSVSIFPIR